MTATILALGLSNIWTLARGYGQGDSSRRALLQRAHAGQPPPQDGPILATGHVRAEGPPLVSPVTGRPCVAYQAYVQATRFDTSAPPVGLVGDALTLVDDLFTEQRLEVRKDWQRTGAPTDLAGLRIEEHVLPVDEMASAWGLWSVDRRGIVPGALRSGAPGIAMLLGPPEGLLGRASGPPSSALAVGVASVVLLALGAGLVWAAREGYVAQAWAAAASLS